MNALSLVKGASDIVISVGAGAIVGNVIRYTTPVATKKGLRVAIGLSGYVISAMVGDYTSKYASSSIDRAVASYAEVKKLVEEAVNKAKEETNNG